MKKVPLAFAVLAGLSIGTAQAADGSINFVGTIMDAGCTIDSADINQSIPMGNVSKTAFSAAGDVAAPTEFTIRLSACPATLLTADARFDGPADASDSRLLAVNGGAQGVAIAIYEQDASTLIPIGVRSASVSLDAGNAGELKFFAKYMATTAVTGIVSGDANATSQFTISYN